LRDTHIRGIRSLIGRLAASSCGLGLLLLTGCAPSEQMIRLDSEMDRLSGDVVELQQSQAGKDGAQDRALRLLEERINTVQLENASNLAGAESVMNQLSALYSRMDDLESQLALCNQKVEVLGTSLQRLERPADTVQMIDSEAETSRTPGIQDSGSSEELYRSAFADYRRGNYELAVVGFKAFLDQFPGNSATGDAHYWLRVIQSHPRNSHVRGAYLKKGYAYIESNQVALGVVQLYHIIDNFPGTSEANLSQQRLKKMGLRRP